MASLIWIQRIAVALLWGLAIYNSCAYRGLFWDGSYFLVHMIEGQGFHDGHTARSHVLWATQWPAVLALRLGVTDTAMLAFAYSAGLFALPAALYHLALHRVRHDGALMAAVLAILASVYLPTSFFIIGEFNVAYAAVTAAACIVLTRRVLSSRDAGLLVAIGFLCLRSYEAMLYLGPTLAAMILWALHGARKTTPSARLLAWTAAGFFLAAAIVALVPTVLLWDHDYVTRVRGAVFDFWQNLQFMAALVALGFFTLFMVLRPSLLRGWPVFLPLAIGIAVLVASPWLREVRPQAQLYPPAHYVARTAAGALLWLMLAAMWAYVAWRVRRPALFLALEEIAVGRRVATAVMALLLAAAIPDIVLTSMWSSYLERFRGLIVGKTGTVRAWDHDLYEWPGALFRQGWTYPTLSLVLRKYPTDALVMPAPAYGEPPGIEPECGVPPLTGYAWRR